MAFIKKMVGCFLAFFRAVLVLYFLTTVAVYTYRWLAWNGLTKDFEAVCTDYRETRPTDLDRLRVVEGPYTREFWNHLREAYRKAPQVIKPEWAIWQPDGSLRVPVGFDFKPSGYDRLFRFYGQGQRPRERSYVIAKQAVSDIFQSRFQDGVPQDFASEINSKYPDTSGLWVTSNACGLMNEIIQAGGLLAQE